MLCRAFRRSCQFLKVERMGLRLIKYEHWHVDRLIQGNLNLGAIPKCQSKPHSLIYDLDQFHFG